MPGGAARETARTPIRGAVFDVDGTLVLSNRSLSGYEVLPGAIEVLTTLKARQVPFALLTNGSAYPPAEQAAKLREVGLPVDDDRMITPSSIAADHMLRRGIRRTLVLGSIGVGQALRDAGIETVHTGEAGATEVGSVFVGWHPECGMKDIETACQAIWGGAELCVASDVPFFATKQGRTIGYSFAITAAIRRLTRAPMTLTGKPSLLALRFVARRLGVPVRALAVVGDDPIVEILMARRGGATALAVTTGTTRRGEWARQARLHRPHGILGELREVLGWVAGAEETAGAEARLRSMRAGVKAARSRTAVQSRPAAQRGVGRRSS
ncbi:MAG: haloacid dehalogenase [Gammaproteobacteria bacterium]|nr:MAG: haloacid dehalogenase [Gammaproteobacteria bacterium]TLY84400.1 MAG: haloacid dehalogenase [Gammaproteobacteria bacterium]